MAENQEKEVDVNHKYAGTLNLPQTNFPMRANALQREPQLLKDLCELYKWQELNNKGPTWVTHDGPPYANGDLHLGHVLGKVLKDFVNRYKMARGYKVSYVPGWDCHGLPIELKALEKLRATASQLTPQELRATARAFALAEVEKQKATFKSWGVMGDWNNPYLTLLPEYEAEQLSLFCDMFENGFVYRAAGPVHWSPSSLTALAEAELEYNENHVSTSVYVAFKVKTLPPTVVLPAEVSTSNLYAVIWTTTPWTLPANVAICVNPSVTYAVVTVKNRSDSRLFLVAADTVQFVGEEIGLELEVVCTVLGNTLEHTVCEHPFVPRESLVCLGGHVKTKTEAKTKDKTGTGLVHTAPGHGVDDFVVGQKYNLPVLCPVGPDGCFTSEAGPRFQGKFVLTEGNATVLSVLKEQNALLKEKKLTHKYPYDWRTKKPVIVRATPQWFVNLADVKGPSVQVVENDVKMVPPAGTTRLASMLGGRSAWCISRQRSWGVPIPVFYDESGKPLINKETVTHLVELVRKHGTDCWWNLDQDLLLPPSYRNNGVKYVKGTDTMDVWFDSGVSWRSVLVNRGIPCPADLYLEGSDQHRGWFQSSLLTSMCVAKKAPYKTVLTHGFVLDDKGRKMSKSEGNVIPPSLITHGGTYAKKNHPAYGVDVLRLFVASSDYTRDVTTSFVSVARVAESLRNLRNRFRFMLSNTHDFNPANPVPYSDLKEVDKYLLLRLYEFGKEVEAGYEQFDFPNVYKQLMNLCNMELSAFYFELVKRRLYTEDKSSLARRSAQTALFMVLDVMLKSVAPFLPHTTEDVYQHWANKSYTQDSIFKTGWFELKEEWNAKELAPTWTFLMRLREDANKLLETMRGDKVIKGPEDADLELKMNKEAVGLVTAKMTPADLAEVFLVSNVYLTPLEYAGTNTQTTQKEGEYTMVCDWKEGEANATVRVTARKSASYKCARCWRFRSGVEGELCTSCTAVCASLPFTPN